MNDPLYERYKEALRAGHVAVLRGRLDEAIEAYRSASEVAPERALPHTSLGGVLLDLGRADDALVEFHAALGIAPDDESALLGRSEALVRLGQPIAAAETLDTLAEVLLASGRDADAVETLQRALVLEERIGRRRQYQRALRALRMSSGDRASDEALGRALGILDAPAVSAAAAAPAAVGASRIPSARPSASSDARSPLDMRRARSAR
jgi:tetratricopeptide (TPR) repeat protein